MKGNSDSYPKELVKSNNMVQARYNAVTEGGSTGHTSVAKTNTWNNVMDAKVAVGGNIEAVQNGWVVVNGVWQKWWPPPST